MERMLVKDHLRCPVSNELKLPPLPFARPDIGIGEERAAVEVLRTGWLTTGPKCREFESAFSEYIGCTHSLTVNSCTAGLHLALEACGVGPGDLVITTPYTFTATAEVVRYLGAEVSFCDVNEQTRNIDPQSLQQVLENSRDIKVIMPVHFAGLACDMKQIMELANQYDCKVIEDAAHALPCSSDGRMIGTIADATAFSFYATKTLSTGEGGMVTTADDELAARIKKMRLHGIDRDVFDRYRGSKPSWYYEIVQAGFKYNMTDLAAAIGIVQLSRIEEMRSRREDIANHYSDAFSRLPIELPPPPPVGDLHAWHLYVIGVYPELSGMGRDDFIVSLAELGIGSSVHFIPLHIQPYWRDRYSLEPTAFPKAMSAYRKAVSLPIYSSMTDADVERVIHAVKTTLSGKGSKS